MAMFQRTSDIANVVAQENEAQGGGPESLSQAAGQLGALGLAAGADVFNAAKNAFNWGNKRLEPARNALTNALVDVDPAGIRAQAESPRRGNPNALTPVQVTNGVGNKLGRIGSKTASGDVTFDPSAGYIMGLGGGSQLADRARRGIEAGRTVALGDEARNPVNYVDFAEANKEFAKANRIRQSAIDMLPQGAGVVRPAQENPLDPLLERVSNPSSPRDMNSAFRAAELLLDSQRTQGIADSAGQNALAQMQAAEMRAQTESNKLAAEAPAQRLQRLKLMQDIVNARNGSPDQLLSAAQELGLQNPQGANQLLALAGLPPIFQEGKADGGFIEPTMQMSMGTGAVGSFGAMGGNGAQMQRYQQYVSKAREMSLPLLGFDEFVSMSQPQKMAMGGMVESYADGGMVDVSGKAVVDTDPNAPTDSIPAVIDGQRPAALDSGEFVIPKDVVQFYGTDKLTKMIEKARKPDDANGNQQSALSQFGGAAAS